MKNSFRTPALLVAVLALSAALSACSKTDAPSSETAVANKPAATKATNNPEAAYSQVAAQAVAANQAGFSVGAVMAANTVYVLFDPQCPHCGQLWNASLPLHKKAKFVWLPVAIMNGKSAPQGAALLTAASPTEAMNAHEASILAGTGGMSAPSNMPADIEKAIKANTQLFTSLGIESVPYVLAKNAQTGQVVTRSGALDTAALAKFLGL